MPSPRLISTNPGVVDTDNLDDELRVRYDARSGTDAMKWLFDGDLDAAQSTGALSELVAPPRESGWLDMTGRFGLNYIRVSKDMVRGALEGPWKGIVGGTRDAVQESLELFDEAGSYGFGLHNAAQAVHKAADEFGDWLNANVADLGAFQLLDKEGSFAPKYSAPGELSADETGLTPGTAILPEIEQPQTVTGNVTRNVVQFLAGFDYPGQCAGSCMGSAAPDGQFVVIAPEQPLNTGDLVAFVTVDGMQYVKVLIGRRETPDGPVWMFGQANPPLVAFQREAELLCMHRVRAFADTDGKESEVDLSPVAAELELIAHLKIGGTWPPLNPDWRLEEAEAA